MTTIKSSTDLRNNYNEISSYCHETGDPVFVTKNGRGDLVVMSIDSFNRLMGRQELYQLLEKSESDFAEGKTLTFQDSFKQLKKELGNESV